MQLMNIYWLLTVLLQFSWWGSTSSVPKETLEAVEANLMSLFGFRKRPNIDRSKVVIPKAMLDMYERQMGHPLDTSSIPRAGLHTQSANTIRSFTHVGRFTFTCSIILTESVFRIRRVKFPGTEYIAHYLPVITVNIIFVNTFSCLKMAF